MKWIPPNRARGFVNLDWRQGVITVPTRKTGHGARLPTTSQVGEVLAEYLRHGQPATEALEV